MPQSSTPPCRTLPLGAGFAVSPLRSVRQAEEAVHHHRVRQATLAISIAVAPVRYEPPVLVAYVRERQLLLAPRHSASLCIVRSGVGLHGRRAFAPTSLRFCVGIGLRKSMLCDVVGLLEVLSFGMVGNREGFYFLRRALHFFDWCGAGRWCTSRWL